MAQPPFHAPPPPPPQPQPPPPEYYRPPIWVTPQPHPSSSSYYSHLRPSHLIVTLARQFSLVVPGVILVLNIWWSATQRVCPPDADAAALCFWLLWLSLPVATASFVWGIVGTISSRRAAHHQRHVPPPVDVAVRLVLAVGASVCFAMLVYHMVRWDVWSTGCEAGMLALLALLMIINWALFAWAALELRERLQHGQQRRNHEHIGI